MAWRTGAKTSVVVTVGTTATDVATLAKVLGAKAILVHVHDAVQANNITVLPAYKIGSVFPANGTLSVVGAVGAANSAAGRMYVIMSEMGINGFIPYPFHSDTIRIQATQATLGGDATFDIWPLYEVPESMGSNLL